MDTSQTPGQSASLIVELTRTPDGRLEGQLRADTGDAWRPFSGVLELLKVLEDLLNATKGN
jgi:hypothetical protein